MCISIYQRVKFHVLQTPIIICGLTRRSHGDCWYQVLPPADIVRMVDARMKVMSVRIEDMRREISGFQGKEQRQLASYNWLYRRTERLVPDNEIEHFVLKYKK